MPIILAASVALFAAIIPYPRPSYFYELDSTNLTDWPRTAPTVTVEAPNGAFPPSVRLTELPDEHAWLLTTDDPLNTSKRNLEWEANCVLTGAISNGYIPIKGSKQACEFFVDQWEAARPVLLYDPPTREERARCFREGCPPPGSVKLYVPTDELYRYVYITRRGPSHNGMHDYLINLTSLAEAIVASGDARMTYTGAIQ